MKRFTASWITTAAAAILLAAPATGAAQTPPPSTPPAAAQPPASGAAAQAQPDAHQGHATAQEHLRKANAALNKLDAAKLPAEAKTHVAEIKRHVNALERKMNAADAADARMELAAIERALTVLLGPANTTGAPPTPTGTSGTTGQNRAVTAITLDPEARGQLNDVRTHIIAYGTVVSGDRDRAEADTTGSPSSAAAPRPATGQGAATASSPQSTQPQQQAGDPATSQPQAAAPTATEEAARRHLMEARNTLSALTQLPAAAQLSGEARTQIAQLISNFNALITSQSQWRDSYEKVSANLASLLGPEPGATNPTGTSGTTGAVGTSGAAPSSVDPAVREKLVELRRHLSEFEKAAGGSSATSGTTPAASSTTPMPSGGTTPPSGTPASPATGTMTSPAQTTPQASTGTTGGAQPTGVADARRHVAAIEALLKMQDDSGGLTLTKTQVEQLRTHWAALKLALDKK